MLYTRNKNEVKYRPLYIYKPNETVSTTIHISHCSIYLRANIHVATILAAVVNESHHGTGESVNLSRISPIKINKTTKTTVRIIAVFRGVVVTGNSSFELSLSVPFNQKYKP